MMRYFFLVALALCHGCVSTTPTPVENTRLTTKVSLSEHNSNLSRYDNKATFMEIITSKNNSSDKAISYQADKYGSGSLWVTVGHNEANIVIDALKKYEKWNSQAKNNSDMFTKDIVQYKAPFNFGKETTLIVGFHSGNLSNHYATFTMCYESSLLAKQCYLTATLDIINAQALKEELIQFRDGVLIGRDVSSKYN